MDIEDRIDLAVSGGGLPGLILALAVKRALGDAIEVAVFDPAGFDPRPDDLRASAIAAGVRRMLEALGLWQALEADAEPILDMVITDSALREPMRPALLSFSAIENKGEPFAHMVPNDVLMRVVGDAARAAGVGLVARPVTGYRPEADAVCVSLSDGDIEAGLLVAADGARSRLREQAGIAFYGWGYGQTALVATIGHERPHGGRAIEHFLPSGPFAILPLAGNRSSIVWTERDAEAKRLLAMPDDLLIDALTLRFGLELGAIELLTPLKAWPLTLGLARSLISDRLALIGDAAHVIHPIAGQGLNLGLKDAAALAERIVDQARLGLDIGDPHVLKAYERDRRFDVSSMAVTTDVLNRLFSRDSDALRAIRTLGLGLVERLPAAKRFFIGEAAALAGAQPKLLAGEML